MRHSTVHEETSQEYREEKQRVQSILDDRIDAADQAVGAEIFTSFLSLDENRTNDDAFCGDFELTLPGLLFHGTPTDIENIALKLREYAEALEAQAQDWTNRLYGRTK
jgi:hypothetical protein